MTAEVAFTRKLIEMGKYAQDLQDEISRLRAFMPADVLREYDSLEQQPVRAIRRDAQRSGTRLAAAPGRSEEAA